LPAYIGRMDEPKGRDGYIDFEGHKTWYRVVGEGSSGGMPLLCLHGGPGATWHHMEPYAALADERPVVFYDQLGCGNSTVTAPHDPAMWTTDLYRREVDVVRQALGLDRCHVIGHSWGGMLAMLYAVSRPAGLESVVVQSSPASVPFWLGELQQLRAELPTEVDEVLRRHEEAGTVDSEEYMAAAMVFYDRHVCRVRPWPDFVQRTFDGLAASPEVYNTLNGPSEFHVIGPLKDFDIEDRLHLVEAPTLFFCGEFDEVTVATARRAHELVAGSKFFVLEACSHMAQAEQPDAVLALLRGWLAGVEAASARA
jgi:L-proline amide hydrolase